MQPNPETSRQRLIAIWLFVCCGLVFAMVVLGGVTRLTGSGLSMVTWEPVKGVLPPLNELHWQEMFEAYQQTPEYQKVNIGMDLDGFKGIFWLEYLHRLLGRLIGLVFLAPFLFFLAKGWIRWAMAPKFAVMFVLGGLQGALGWYMVASGLVDNPHVSQYRLTAHLLAALLIYGFMLWVGLGFWYGQRREAVAGRGLRVGTLLGAAAVTITIASGGFVAGLKAGLAYNTFPLMDGRWVPATYGMLDPWWLNAFENIAAVQFNHRLLAILTLVGLLALWLLSRRAELPTRLRRAFALLPAVALVQVALGITTLLMHVPVALGSLHQAVALVVFSVVLYLVQGLWSPTPRAVPEWTASPAAGRA